MTENVYKVIELVGTSSEYIVPWQAAYLSTRLLGGEVTFVLGGTGHIAGVINPPAKNERNHWVGGVRTRAMCPAAGGRSGSLG